MCVFLWGELPSGSVQPLKALLCFSGRLCRGSLPCAGAAALPADSSRHCNGFPAGAEVTNRPAPWRPLVLLIPLRLGLTDINEAYVETLKVRLPRPRGDCNTAARCGASWPPPGQPRPRWGSLPAPPPPPQAHCVCAAFLVTTARYFRTRLSGARLPTPLPRPCTGPRGWPGGDVRPPAC